MQIVITVGEEGRATAQILGAAPIGAPVTYTAEAEEVAFDAGAAPAIEEELEGLTDVEKTGPGKTGTELETLDGGAAPLDPEEVDDLPAGAPPAESGAAEEAGAAPTISDVFPPESGIPRLRPVD